MNRLFPNIRLGLVLLASVLLSACANNIVTSVSSFNQWPQDTQGSLFTFITPPASPYAPPNELEQATYQKYVQIELEKQGLQRAASGQQARLLVELSTITQAQQRTYLQPVYDDRPAFYPPFRNAAGQWIPGYWGPSRFGPSYVGDRVVPYLVQFNQLNVRILDTRNSPPGRPHPVFESRAVYEGDAELPTVAPYLARAVFDNFPGQNGQVRKVLFNRETGAVLQK
ncbi:DUF4136 domain-containing protein [Polaromonas sp. UC242_47]|uniref:DUF4136 domain-containing protein n=1 Tax=Polaromonas sp. UC242_47 TaxID=3374626 RepID=UPI003795BC57